MTNAVIAGSEGLVGRVLTGRGLGTENQLQATITRLDVVSDKEGTDHPYVQSDLMDDEQILQLLATNDTWIHAAWSGEGILDPSSHNPKNLELVERLLRCQQQLGTAATCKIVLISSVNANVPGNWPTRQKVGALIGVDEPPHPLMHNNGGLPGPRSTRYGFSKIDLEHQGMVAAASGAHIVVPRLGGVNLRDQLPSAYPPYLAIAEDPNRGAHFDLRWEDAVRLRHDGLIDRMQSIVDAPYVPNTYDRFNLVSDSALRVHEM